MDLPIVDLQAYLAGGQEAKKQAQATADALIKYGALIVKDARVTEASNDAFLDLLEDYFAQSDEILQRDTRPELHYQVGATLENCEKPVCRSDTDCRKIIQALDPKERPLDLEQSHSDPKCRFFYRMEERSPNVPASDYLENVIPESFKEVWQSRMDSWGEQMKAAVEGVAVMLSDGLGLDPQTLVQAGRYGHHLLAPTATNLDKYGQLNSIYAGFHSDLNCLTIHGRSRYPGLHIWARNTGKRLTVKVPPGHLLVQAGMQIEHLTGGRILAGFHEVVCTQATLDAIEKAKRNTPDRPRIRISSTFFWHLSPDFHLKPIPQVSDSNTSKLYPDMTVKEQVHKALRAIALAAA